jgi:hypothetical protein
MSNIIEFPMDRVRLSPTTEHDFFFDALTTAVQTIDLEMETAKILDQAKAIEEQSQRVLDLMTDLENY